MPPPLRLLLLMMMVMVMLLLLLLLPPAGRAAGRAEQRRAAQRSPWGDCLALAIRSNQAAARGERRSLPRARGASLGGGLGLPAGLQEPAGGLGHAITAARAMAHDAATIRHFAGAGAGQDGRLVPERPARASGRLWG